MSIREQSRRDAEFDRLLAETACVNPAKAKYTEEDMRRVYEMGERHGAESGPRWHDAPTCAGEWSDGLAIWDVEMSDGRPYIDAWGETVYCDRVNRRWFGPIPADEVKA